MSKVITNKINSEGVFMMETFMDTIKYIIDCEYTFASVIIDVDRAQDKFNIVCQVNPKFFIVIDKSDILGLSRSLPFSIHVDISGDSTSPISDQMEWLNNGGFQGLTQAVKDCVNRLWLNLIRSRP